MGCLALAGVLVAFTQFVGDTEGNRAAAHVLSTHARVNDCIRAQQTARRLVAAGRDGNEAAAQLAQRHTFSTQTPHQLGMAMRVDPSQFMFSQVSQIMMS